MAVTSKLKEDDQTLADLRETNPHLNEYVQSLRGRGINRPVLQKRLDRDLKTQDEVNILYPLGDPLFVHVYGRQKVGYKYNAVEPSLDPEGKELYDELKDYIFTESAYEEVCEKPEELKELIFRTIWSELKIKMILHPYIRVVAIVYHPLFFTG